jgi:hypothetical protein
MRNPWNAIMAEAGGTFLFSSWALGFVGIGASAVAGADVVSIALPRLTDERLDCPDGRRVRHAPYRGCAATVRHPA